MKERKHRFTRPEWSWIFYDWANSVWATNIAAAIFPIYFALKATETGNAVYGYSVSLANLIVAVLAPFLGAVSDFRGMKKRLWTLFLVIGAGATAVIAIFGSWQMMLIGFMLSRIGFSGSCLFYDSFLTDVTEPDRMDKVSAWGYAMGYIGGSTIPFVLSILCLVLLDFSDLSYRLAIGIVPVWWLLFSLPFMRNVEQKHFVDTPPRELRRTALRNTWETLGHIVKDKTVLLFLIAYFFYIDGVDTVISMATNYGSTLGLGTIGMVLALLVTQIVAVPCTILFGNWGKHFGALKLIRCAVALYVVITLVGFFMGFGLEPHQEAVEKALAEGFDPVVAEIGPEEEDGAYRDYCDALREALTEDLPAEAIAEIAMPENVPAAETAYGAAVRFAEENGKILTDYRGAIARSSVLFWILAVLVGTVQGGIQAMSRSFFGQIIPPERSGEYFGFMDIFGKFACVVGPALYALFLGITGRPSIGILSLVLLFLAGGVVLTVGRKDFARAEQRDRI